MRRGGWAVALLSALATQTAAAEVIALQAVRDNTLYEDPDGALSSGAGVGLFAGRTRGLDGMLIKRGLIAFDLAGRIPAGSTIQSATLTLCMAKTSAPAADVSLHRMTADWGEGTSSGFGGGGAPATPGDATWLHRFYPSVPWSSAGGDFIAAPSAVQTVGGLGLYHWSAPALTNDVQAMLDAPSSNHGWLLMGDESGGTTVKLFSSREAFSAADRPVLTVDYAPPATIASYCTAGISASGCEAVLAASGTPSASAPTGFLLQAVTVEGSKDGLFFFGANGRQANPWGNGTSFQCVVPPVARAGLMTGTGTSGACNGSFLQDLNALWCPACPAPSKNPGPGVPVQAQLWFRDPLNTSNRSTSLSDALEFILAP